VRESAGRGAWLGTGVAGTDGVARRAAVVRDEECLELDEAPEPHPAAIRARAASTTGARTRVRAML